MQAEIAAHEAASTQPALKAAFPVAKTLESSHVAASSIRPAILDYLPSLERRGNRKGVVEKVNHAASQRWWRTLAHDLTVEQAQAGVDCFAWAASSSTSPPQPGSWWLGTSEQLMGSASR